MYTSQMPVDGFCLVLLTCRLYRMDISPLLILREISDVGQSLRKVGEVDPGSCFVFMTSSIRAAVPSNSCWNCAKWGLTWIRAKCVKDTEQTAYARWLIFRSSSGRVLDEKSWHQMGKCSFEWSSAASVSADNEELRRWMLTSFFSYGCFP